MTEELEKKVQILINLQARALIRDFETQKDKVEFLSDCGFGNAEIAEILGTTSGYVSVAKTKLRKQRDKGSKDEG